VYPICEHGSDGGAMPTTCPNDTNHVITGTALVVGEVDPVQTVKLQEEETGKETNGAFKSKTLHIDAVANQTTSEITWEPYPIGALQVSFVAEEMHRGDTITLCVGPDTTTGMIIGDVTPAMAWSAQNYTTGQTVTWTHPTFGERVYTCIMDTVANEAPPDTTYWRHGFALMVSPTVLQNALPGKYIKLTDGIKQDSVDRIVSVDLDNDKIYVHQSPTNSFLAATPTYVQQTTIITKDWEIAGPGKHIIGQSKVGASHIPTDVVISVDYTNKSPDIDKVFVGIVEYLE